MSLQRYEIHTTVDITNTKNTNPKGNSKEYLQMQNLNSVLQVLGMRAQVLDLSVTKNKSKIFKKRTNWVLTFDCDITGAWAKQDNPVYFIEQDLNNIPVYSGLEETKKSDQFKTTGKDKNTYVLLL